MNRVFSSLIICISSIIIFSCSNDLEEDMNRTVEVEYINGFEVKWRSTATEEQKKLVSQILNSMVEVEGGIFLMGATGNLMDDARENEYPAHYVKLSDYYICAYELSKSDVEGVMDERYGNTEHLYWSFEDWRFFISVLNDISGLNFDFPTEAQWEYAARGGKESKGYVYPGSNNRLKVWTSSSVDSKSEPNELGIYNMGDLLSEWCKDAYSEYSGEKVLLYDPCVRIGEGHVVRGGNYATGFGMGEYTKYPDKFPLLANRQDNRFTRVSCRHYLDDYRSNLIGCRLVVNKK